MARSQTTPSGKPDPTSASHLPLGVHSVISMAPSAPAGIEEGGDESNLMVTESGERFYAVSPEDALLFAVEHGARVAHPSVWPWPGVLTPAVLDVSHCPVPQICFPYGVDPSWVAAACIHGATP